MLCSLTAKEISWVYTETTKQKMQKMDSNFGVHALFLFLSKFNFMSIKMLRPSSELEPYIRLYWSLESSLKPEEYHIQRIVPSGLPEIIFYENNIPDSTAECGNTKSLSQICGQKNNFFDLTLSGKTKLFSIVFQPYGLSAILDIPVSELLNQTLPLRYLLGKQIDELEYRILEAKSIESKIGIVEQYLKKLLSQKQDYNLPRISHSIKNIGCRSIFEQIPVLASNACLSRKQFERNFTEKVGISPKQFMRVVRFQRALYIRQNSPTIKQTELAYDAGYYDQSHMISEFRLLSGYTPKQYMKRCQPYSDYFSEI